MRDVFFTLLCDKNIKGTFFVRKNILFIEKRINRISRKNEKECILNIYNVKGGKIKRKKELLFGISPDRFQDILFHLKKH